MNQTGSMLLTSTGLSSKNVYDKFVEIKNKKNLKKAVMITAASNDKENNQYNQMGLSQLKSVGIEVVDFYDFENDTPKDLASYNVIYVCGGNTFKLMKFAREANFDKDIKSLLERNGVYVGVSAGSLIVGPSIQIANEVHPDKNEFGVTDFTGFNFTDLVIFPHYSSDVEEEIKLFENTNNVKIERLDNLQAILVENGEKTLV